MPAKIAEPRPYHREDLRQELLHAARAYVCQHGHHSLSVRTLAQATGVSPAAPYHHFKDRRELLLAVALDGYAELSAGAVRAVSETADASTNLLSLSLAFVDFARTNPRLIELMYESELTSPTLDPKLLVHHQLGRRVLQNQLDLALPEVPETERIVRALSLWSTIYGFSNLRNKHLLDNFEPDGITANELSRKIMGLAVKVVLEPFVAG